MNGPRSRVLSWAMPIVSMICLVAIAECALRGLAPVHFTGIQSAYEYDEELGYRLRPGNHQYLLTDHLEEIRTGPLGTVGFQDDFSRYPALAFSLGDSYTQGTGNPADTSYPFQLDLLLNQDEDGLYQERLGVVNLGLAAFGAEQSLLAARRYEGIVGRPAYVLYFGCDNDFDDDVLFRSGYRHGHLVAGNPRWGRLVDPLLWLTGFELVKRAKLLASELKQAPSSAATGGGAATGASSSAPVAERVWPVVSEIVALARDWNATLVVSWANPDTDSYHWLQRKAAEEGLRFADWVPAMKAVEARMPGLPHANTHSSGHWRPWTNRVIAESYARAMGVWPASVPPAPSAR